MPTGLDNIFNLEEALESVPVGTSAKRPEKSAGKTVVRDAQFTQKTKNDAEFLPASRSLRRGNDVYSRTLRLKVSDFNLIQKKANVEGVAFWEALHEIVEHYRTTAK